MPAWLSCLTAVAGIGGVVFTLFWRADAAVSPRAKAAIAQALRTDIHRMTLGLPRSFSAAFDGLFGRRFRAPRFCLASGSLSLALSMIFTMAWAYVGRPHQLAHLNPPLDDPRPLYGPQTLRVIWNWAWIFLVITLPADYLSNIETRLVLRRASEVRHLRSLALWLMADLLFSVALFAGWFSLSILALDLWRGNSIHGAAALTVNKVEELFRYGLYLSNDTYPKRIGTSAEGLPVYLHTVTISNGIFLYTSLATSAWLWLYLFSSVLVAAVFRLERLKRAVIGWFDVDVSPFTFLGYLATLIAVGVLLILLGTGRRNGPAASTQQEHTTPPPAHGSAR
jgi:hypothetical protein